MKKKLAFFVIILSFFVFPPLILGQGRETQNRAQDPVATPQEVQTQTQAQIQTQTQAQIQTTNQEVERLMNMRGPNEETREQIRNFAQEQERAQTQIQTELNKLESRNRWIKILIGPDFGAIKNLRQQMEQNLVRIELLEEIKTQLVNQTEESQIQAVIEALVEQNTALQAQIQAEEQTRSLFGWLFKFFSK